ncbi:MAG: hypothetical protein R3F17_17325 [Planctomycetota bacterium]
MMTGAANPDIADPTYALLPGSFADHLTSYAGALLNNSQTKMTLWLTKGASGTSGAIEEPCNYSGKFPTAALHTSYRGGTTLGEAWFRHMGFVPLQTLFLGDPLTRPWTQNNPVAVNNAPVGPWSGSWDLDVSATAALPGATIATLELWLDGVRLARVAAPGPLQLESGGLADGLHEVRVRAIDDSAAEHAGEWSGWIQVANAGLSVDLTCAQPAGDLAQVYTFDFAVTGGVPERVQLLRGGRVVASSPQGSGSVDLYGSSLGAGPVRVIAEARFAGGLRARSAPVDLQIDYSGAASAVPIAFDADLDAAARGTVLVELPASAPDPGFDLTYTVLSAPAQATLVGGFGSWRVYDVPATAYGEDNLTFQVTGPAGPSNPATVTLHYQNECPDPYVYCTASANSTGAPAHIFHTGSTQISQDQFILGAYSVPAGSFGLFVYGQDQTAFPAGDGTFCMQNNWQRLPIVQADPFGLVSHALDFQNPPQPTGMITAGSTWGFQLWYRDTGFGQAGYNFTDALSVTFCD